MTVGIEQGVEICVSLNADVNLRSFVQFCSGQRLNLYAKTLKESSKVVPVLRIPEGQAEFGPGGVLRMKFPAWEAWRETVGIEGHHVLFILQLSGDGRMEKNWYFCENCATCTGEMKLHRSGTSAGKMNAEFSCHLCGKSWWRENI